MNVLVDTCIWSSALRKRPTPTTQPLIVELKKLLYYGQAALPGLVRLEILAGLHRPHFEKVRNELRKLEDMPVDTEDYESAAEIFTVCRSKGIQGSTTDFLLCALSQRHDMPIFTTDKDFALFSKYIPLRLHTI